MSRGQMHGKRRREYILYIWPQITKRRNMCQSWKRVLEHLRSMSFAFHNVHRMKKILKMEFEKNLKRKKNGVAIVTSRTLPDIG